MNQYTVRAEVLLVVQADTPEEAAYRAGCFAVELSGEIEEDPLTSTRFGVQSAEFFFEEEIEPSCPRLIGRPQ